MSQTVPDEGGKPRGKEIVHLPKTDTQIEMPAEGRVERIVRYVEDKVDHAITYAKEKVGKGDPEVMAEKKKIDELKSEILKAVGAMVSTTSNIYLLFVSSLERTGASSQIWEKLKGYMDKGLAQEAKNRYSVPPNIEHRDFVHMKNMFEEAKDSESLRVFLQIVLQSDEKQLALIAKWQQHHENDIEKIQELHYGSMQVRSRSAENYRRLTEFSNSELAPTYEHLIILLEYLAQTSRFSYDEAERYIQVNLHRQGPYR